MDYVSELKKSPIEPKSIRGYKVWEPESGWTQETMEMVLEMLRRGYNFTLVPLRRSL